MTTDPDSALQHDVLQATRSCKFSGARKRPLLGLRREVARGDGDGTLSAKGVTGRFGAWKIQGLTSSWSTLKGFSDCQSLETYP
eukprot:CAMPEP_0181509152 /NCGR_PEP_ID=MMETSP1110-20121109/60182_1 /TAXON_ID=174948 /ORGANISM="Symbiodinium sp., Strain CCMP421" /LENGTH=83 /DNA_ID=CAMNT_0023638671 /DNA_START=80 /DNA_END=328 /DNA_ORIENTATION=+